MANSKDRSQSQHNVNTSDPINANVTGGRIPSTTLIIDDQAVITPTDTQQEQASPLFREASVGDGSLRSWLERSDGVQVGLGSGMEG
ncbi:hypothetical protein LWI29_022027 [Acer saccharum]|uniref:Uncharacterized protein n=1 Tax=Acer saccharum TaxID=4024 RepID=A0AA39W8Q9_ACESA|nr:hypothetical protein LWI29_022027 [Acer saccharum]